MPAASAWPYGRSAAARSPTGPTQSATTASRRRISRARRASTRPAPSPWTTATSWWPAPPADSQFGLVRYTDQPGSPNDGEPDTDFRHRRAGDDGLHRRQRHGQRRGRGRQQQYDLVAGYVLDGNGDKEVALARYNDADGSLDTTFGSNGARHDRPGERLEQHQRWPSRATTAFSWPAA